jgi:exopolyphosphatase/pppGpp-phosphohydrolase
VERLLDGFHPPERRTALAVGGSARALRRIVGGSLGREELAVATDILARTPSAELIARYDLSPERVATLAGGAVILTVLQQHLGTPMKVVRAGLRDGAVLRLGDERRAAA